MSLLEPSFPVRLIAIDIDGTLLEADGAVSSRNLAAIVRQVKQESRW